MGTASRSSSSGHSKVSGWASSSSRQSCTAFCGVRLERRANLVRHRAVDDDVLDGLQVRQQPG